MWDRYEDAYKQHKKPLLAWEFSKGQVNAATEVAALELPYAPTSVSISQAASASVTSMKSYVMTGSWEDRVALERTGYSAQDMSLAFVLDDSEAADEDLNVEDYVLALSTMTQPQSNSQWGGQRQTDSQLVGLFSSMKTLWQDSGLAAGLQSVGGYADLSGGMRNVLSHDRWQDAGGVLSSGVAAKSASEAKPWGYWLAALKAEPKDTPDTERPFKAGLVRFYWGEKFMFSGFATSLDLKILVVDKKGRIRRAEVGLKLVGAAFVDTVTPPRGENPDPGESKPQEVRLVTGGENQDLGQILGAGELRQRAAGRVVASMRSVGKHNKWARAIKASAADRRAQNAAATRVQALVRGHLERARLQEEADDAAGAAELQRMALIEENG